MHPDGSTYQYSEMGLYGQLVHPLVGILLVVLMYLLYRAKGWRFIQVIEFPTKSFFLLLLFIFMSWLGEKGNFSVFHGELAEELAELGVYLMMVYLVNDSLKKQTSK